MRLLAGTNQYLATVGRGPGSDFDSFFTADDHRCPGLSDGECFHGSFIVVPRGGITRATKSLLDKGLRAHFFASEVTPATRRAFQPGKGGSCPTRTLFFFAAPGP